MDGTPPPLGVPVGRWSKKTDLMAILFRTPKIIQKGCGYTHDLLGTDSTVRGSFHVLQSCFEGSVVQSYLPTLCAQKLRRSDFTRAHVLC